MCGGGIAEDKWSLTSQAIAGEQPGTRERRARQEYVCKHTHTHAYTCMCDLKVSLSIDHSKVSYRQINHVGKDMTSFRDYFFVSAHDNHLRDKEAAQEKA